MWLSTFANVGSEMTIASKGAVSLPFLRPPLRTAPPHIACTSSSSVDAHISATPEYFPLKAPQPIAHSTGTDTERDFMTSSTCRQMERIVARVSAVCMRPCFTKARLSAGLYIKLMPGMDTHRYVLLLF